MTGPIGTLEDFSVGDRVEIVAYGKIKVHRETLTVTSGSGIIVAFNPSYHNHNQWCDVVLLMDPEVDDDRYPCGQPRTVRIDQIRHERTVQERLNAWPSDIEAAIQLFEIADRRRASRKGLAKILNLFDRQTTADLASKTALVMVGNLKNTTVQKKKFAPTIYTAVEDLSFGDRVRAYYDHGDNNTGWTKDCVFLCEVNGIRFFTYPHGGAHGLPVAHVLADPLLPKKKAPIKV